MNTYEAYFQTAVILAGGRSSRMGFDKQLLMKEDKRLAVWLAGKLSEDFKEVIVVTNRPDLYDGLPVRTISDIYPGLGPMSGIHSAFCHSDSEILFVMACDMTDYNPSYARFEAERMEADASLACVTMHGDKLENFHGFYKRGLLSDMEACLKEERSSIFRFLKARKISMVTQEEIPDYVDFEKLFRNLNTQDEYMRFQMGEGE